MLGIGYWRLDIGSSILDIEYWVLDVGYLVFEIGDCILAIRYCIFDIGDLIVYTRSCNIDISYLGIGDWYDILYTRYSIFEIEYYILNICNLDVGTYILDILYW